MQLKGFAMGNLSDVESNGIMLSLIANFYCQSRVFKS